MIDLEAQLQEVAMAAITQSRVQPQQPRKVHWEPPKIGHVKINVDGSVKLSTRDATIEDVCRDHEG